MCMYVVHLLAFQAKKVLFVWDTGPNKITRKKSLCSSLLVVVLLSETGLHVVQAGLELYVIDDSLELLTILP